MFAFLENKNLISYTFSMQPYKTIVLFLSFFILAAFCNTSAHEIRLESAVFQAQHALFEPVLKDIQDYYGRTSFEDENRQTGWYRVDDFLKWLKENEKILKYKTVRLTDKRIPLTELHSSPEKDDQKIFWGYLGAQYAFACYNLPSEVLDNYIFDTCSSESCFADPKDNSILFGELNSADSIALFNLGLHEAVHLFSTAPRAFTPHTALPEAASCKAQNLWGLPVKSNNNYSSGVRDFRVSYQRGISPDKMAFEYTDCILTPFYNNTVFETLHKREEFSFCSFLHSLAPQELYYEELKIDANEQVNFLENFFGKEKWQTALKKADKNTFSSLGEVSYHEVMHFYERYLYRLFTAFHQDDSEVRNQVHALLEDLPHDSYIPFLYKWKDKVFFAYYPKENFFPLPDQKLKDRFGENEIHLRFYEKMLQKFYETGGSCQELIPIAVELLDELAGPQTRAAVPPGYI